MKKTADIKNLFNQQGCISTEGLREYIAGEMSLEAREVLEKHVVDCELCREAIEGTPYFKNVDEFSNGLTKLNEKWGRKNQSERVLSKATIAGLVSIAASVMLLVGLYIVSQYQREQRSEMIARSIDQGARIEEISSSEQAFFTTITGDTRNLNSLQDESVREEFLMANTTPEVSTIPITLMEETQVYAYKTKSESIVPPKPEPRPKPQLRYPFRVMSMPPPEMEERNALAHEHSEVFNYVEEMPKFYHKNIQDFNNYIARFLHYPSLAIEKNISGRVYVQFTIDEEGKLTDIEVLKSSSTLLNSEVIRVLRNSPEWTPGKQKGKAVKVSMVMPVEFRLYQ